MIDGAAQHVRLHDQPGAAAAGRVIDGAVAAQWMAAFVRRIENPLTILI